MPPSSPSQLLRLLFHTDPDDQAVYLKSVARLQGRSLLLIFFASPFQRTRSIRQTAEAVERLRPLLGMCSGTPNENKTKPKNTALLTFSLAPSLTLPITDSSLFSMKMCSGPDGIDGSTLKFCTDQLSGVLRHLFHASTDQHSVTSLWKISTIIPAPIKIHSETVLEGCRAVVFC